MASNTPNLNLYKKDPTIDGNDTFNIKTMLNDNWDKIDAAVTTKVDKVDFSSHLADEATPQYDTPATTTSEVTRLNCLNKNLVSLVITGKTIVNLLGSDGDCEDISKFNNWQSTLALDTSNKVVGSNGIKVTITGTSGTCFKYVPQADATKYYFASAYIKNGNTSGGLTFKAYSTNSTGRLVKSSQTITDTSKFTRVGVVIQPSDWGTGFTNFQLDVMATGSSGQYFYVDGFMLKEITADEYALGIDVLMDKYPYISGDVSVGDAPTRVKSRGKNLFNENNLYQGTYSTLGTKNNYYQGLQYALTRVTFNSPITVKSNTDYVLSLSPTLNGSTNIYVIDFTTGNAITAWTNKNTKFTTLSDTKQIVIVFWRDSDAQILTTEFIGQNIQLEEGSTPTAYEPYQDTVMPTQYPLRSLGNIADIQDTRKGKVIKKLEKLIADGSLNWSYLDWRNGRKYVKAIINISKTAGYTEQDYICYKYNNKKLFSSSSANSNIYPNADGCTVDNDGIYITVSTADSGWGDNYTPTSAEIQAYFYGWRMYDTALSGTQNPFTNTSLPANKRWCRVDKNDSAYNPGTDLTNILPITQNTNVLPYRLYYQLATPVEIDIPVSDIVALTGGSLVVENDAQCWVRPSIAYTLNKNSKANLDGIMNQLNKASVKFNSIDLSQYTLKSQQDTWHQASLQNGWQNINYGLQFTKDNAGNIHLRCAIWNGTIANDTLIANLPVGYRPLNGQYKPIVNYDYSYNTYPAFIVVGGNGDIRIYGVKTNLQLMFDVIIRSI